MPAPSPVTTPVLTTEPPLDTFTESVRKERAIAWYRTKLPPGALKKLHERSDLRAWWQTGGYLFLLLLPLAVAGYAAPKGLWWLALPAVLFYGFVSAFLINAVHELIHGTVFRTKWLNTFFAYFFAFLGQINHLHFGQSHVRHHRYTLHPPEDLEETLPSKLVLKKFWSIAFINFQGMRWNIAKTIRVAQGKFEGEWERTLYPPDQPAKWRPVIRWARILLGGHALLLIGGFAIGQPVIPLMIFVGKVFLNGPFWLCNNTQHIGLQDNVSDFRLCCRTFTLHPFLRFLNWQMNYQIEHHMYAAVPCYHLDALHKLIRHDLPPTPNGLRETWCQIADILRKQQADPSYQYIAPLPSPQATSSG